MADRKHSAHVEEKKEPIQKPIERKLSKSHRLTVRGLLGLKKTAGVVDTKIETRRRFLFDDRALMRGGHGRDLFAAEEMPEEDMNDIVDVDDDRIVQYVSQELVGAVVESGFFKAFIFILIIINSILIALQTDETMSVKYRYMFSIFDQIVMATFVCEILLKWYYGFWVFWKAGWNILDFMIIAALLLGPQLAFLSSSRILRILRVMRAFRSLRSVSALAGLSLVVQTILQSIPDMANILLLLMIVLLVFGVSGVTLFGSVVPDRFGDLPTALFSLFICVTQDGWVDIYNAFKVQGGWVHIGGMLYFFCSIMVGAFVFANLVVAVVVTNLELAMSAIRSEVAYANAGLDGTDMPDNEENQAVINQRDFDGDSRYMRQNPLQYADLSKITIEQFTNYNLLLVAFEENLAEYKNIRGDLDKIYTLIATLNLEEEGDEDVLSNHTANEPLSGVKGLKGDILSNLIRLEESRSVDSRDKQSIDHVIRSLGGDTLADPRKHSMRPKRSFRKRSSIPRSSVDL